MEKCYLILNKEQTGYLNVDTGKWVRSYGEAPTFFSYHERVEYENERLIPNGASWVEAFL